MIKDDELTINDLNVLIKITNKIKNDLLTIKEKHKETALRDEIDILRRQKNCHIYFNAYNINYIL